jgi:molybdopterin-guanine dinucleotide biosynthesis protein A
MRAALQRGTRRISAVLAAMRVDILDPADLARYDPHNHSACNLNTPADLERVRHILAHCADAVQWGADRRNL